VPSGECLPDKSKQPTCKIILSTAIISVIIGLLLFTTGDADALKSIIKESLIDSLYFADRQGWVSMNYLDVNYARFYEGPMVLGYDGSGKVMEFIKNKQYADARNLIDTMLEREPNNPSLQHDSCSILIYEQEDVKSVGCFRHIESKNSEDKSTKIGLALSLNNFGLYDEAYNILISLQQKSAEDPELENIIAMVRTNQSNGDLSMLYEAEQSYVQLIRNNNQMIDAWANLGWVQMKSGNYDSCLESLNHTLQLDPNHQWAKKNSKICVSLSNNNMLMKIQEFLVKI